MPAEQYKESPYSFTVFNDVPVAVCNDCGATAPTVDAVRHHANCQPGESEKWAAFYAQPDPDDADLDELTRFYYGEL